MSNKMSNSVKSHLKVTQHTHSLKNKQKLKNKIKQTKKNTSRFHASNSYSRDNIGFFQTENENFLRIKQGLSASQVHIALPHTAIVGHLIDNVTCGSEGDMLV